MRRIEWDLHSAPFTVPLGNPQGGRGFFGGANTGPLVMPGKYKVSMAMVFDGKTTQLAARRIQRNTCGHQPMSAEDHAQLMAFAEKAAKLQAAIVAAADIATNIQTEIGDVKRAR